MNPVALVLSVFVVIAEGVFLPAQNVHWEVVHPLENGYVSLYPALTHYDPGTGADVLLIHNHMGGSKLLDVKPGEVFLYDGTGYEVVDVIRSVSRPDWNPYPAGYLVFQTCLTADGSGWLFIWAKKL